MCFLTFPLMRIEVEWITTAVVHLRFWICDSRITIQGNCWWSLNVSVLRQLLYLNFDYCRLKTNLWLMWNMFFRVFCKWRGWTWIGGLDVQRKPYPSIDILKLFIQKTSYFMYNLNLLYQFKAVFDFWLTFKEIKIVSYHF